MVIRSEGRMVVLVIILLTATVVLIYGIISLLFGTEIDVTPKGRLHVDNVEEYKYVYVENFGDSKTGCDIYVRVRLHEYFEYGYGAGGDDTNKKYITVVRSGILSTTPPLRNYPESWDIFDYYDEVNDDVVNIRHFINLKFGGQTIYMPTFNKNYNSDEVDEKDLDKPYKNTQILSMPTYYPDLFSEEGYRMDKIEEHEARETLVGRVLTMSQWKQLGYPVGENLWVFDTDGWAYWAQPLEADTATGVLLNKIVEGYDINSDWYYNINPVMEYTTKENFVAFEEKTSEAVILLDKISGGDVENNK